MGPNGGEEKETKNSESRIRIQEPPQIRCGKCMNCTRTSPCGACYQCTRGRMGACANRLCSEQQKQHLLGILQAKQAKSPMETNGTSPLTSVLGHLRDDFLGAKKERGRQSAIERCNVCENCLRTERCGSCANCLKQASTCTRQRCKERIKACNERAKQKKQDQWQVGEGNLNGEKPSPLGKRSMLESWSTSPNGVPPKKNQERRLCPANQQRLDKDDQRVDVYRGPEAPEEGDGAAPVGGDHQLQLANSPTAHQWDSRCGECTGCQMLSG